MNNYRRNRILTGILYRLHYLVLAALVLLLYFEYEKPYIYIVLGVFAVYVGLFELFMFRTGRNSRAAAQNIISMLDMTSQKRINDFPIPVIITQEDGTVIWQSELFIDTVGEEQAREVTDLSELDEKLPVSPMTEIQLAGRNFEVYTDCSVQNGAELRIHYFFDITDFRILEDKYNKMRPAVAHVLIDNYDELFANVREDDKSRALNTIYEEIRKWAAKTSGLLVRAERDRFVFIFDNSVLMKETEDRFSILDSVRALPLGLKTFPTLSIGIGFDGESYSGNDDHARAAIDTALSRGGDQVVIKNAKGYEFFGGTTKETEKSSRIKARVIASALGEIFKSVDTVYVMGHKFADFDALGACVGFYRIAVTKGKKAYIVLDSNSNLAERLSEQFRLSGEYEEVFISSAQACERADKNGLVVIVDTHRPSYTMAPELLGKTDHCLVIDHHRRNVDYITGTDIFYHDPAASSSCEMVAQIMQYIPECIPTKLEAEALLSGIYLDTKSYTIRTSPSTFETSFFLKKLGANTVNVKMLFQTGMDTYREKVKLMKCTETYRDITAIAVWPEIAESTSDMKLVCAQAADDLLSIENVYAAFTLFQDNFGTVSISARSYGVINVQLILEDLGGGGHQTMSGAQINCSPEEAVEKLHTAIDRYLNAANLKNKINSSIPEPSAEGNEDGSLA